MNLLVIEHKVRVYTELESGFHGLNYLYQKAIPIACPYRMLNFLFCTNYARDRHNSILSYLLNRDITKLMFFVVATIWSFVVGRSTQNTLDYHVGS